MGSEKHKNRVFTSRTCVQMLDGPLFRSPFLQGTLFDCFSYHYSNLWFLGVMEWSLHGLLTCNLHSGANLRSEYCKLSQYYFREIESADKDLNLDPAILAWSVECLLHKKCHILVVDRIPLVALYLYGWIFMDFCCNLQFNFKNTNGNSQQ